MRERGTEGDRVGLPSWEGVRKEGGRQGGNRSEAW